MNHTTSTFVRIVATGAVALPLLLGAAACSDSESATTTTDALGKPAGEPAGDPTATPTGDPVATFCDGFVEVDGVLASLMGPTGPPDTATLEAAAETVEAVRLAAPRDLRDPMAALADQTVERFEDPAAEPSQDLTGDHAAVVGWMIDNCDFTAIEVEAMDYHFDGLPEELPAGKATVRLTNVGTELHEMVMFRIADGVTETLDELLELPEDQIGDKIQMAGASFATPGEQGYATVDLQEGRYAMVCFIPVGTTPEAMEEEPAGPPHFVQGMAHEVTVR